METAESFEARTTVAPAVAEEATDAESRQACALADPRMPREAKALTDSCAIDEEEELPVLSW